MMTMNQKNAEIFALAMGLTSPWKIDSIEFKAVEEAKNSEPGSASKSTQFELHVYASYDHVITQEKVHDHKDRTWRHLDFFQHKAFIHARVPRIIDKKGSVKQVQVPWAREGSGFTLLFEMFVIELTRQMPVAAVGRMVREHDTRLWRVIEAYVEEGRKHQDFSDVTGVGIDETSSKKGHQYITVFASLGSHKVIFCCEGRDSSVIKSFKDDFETHSGNCAKIANVSIDMSKAFISGVKTHLPNAEINFDEFHVIKAMNEAVNSVRREEAKKRPELKGTRFAWLKNEENQNEDDKEIMNIINPLKCNWDTARAYRYKLGLQACFSADKDQVEAMLKKWLAGACRTSLKPVKDVALMVKRHYDGIVAAIKNDITNGLMEGLNSLIQAAKVKARGYRNTKTLCNIVYLMQGGIDFSKCFASDCSVTIHTT